MSVPTYQESYETYPKPTQAELEMADKLIAEALKELESEPPKTHQETIAEFERVREEIINQYPNILSSNQ